MTVVELLAVAVGTLAGTALGVRTLPRRGAALAADPTDVLDADSDRRQVEADAAMTVLQHLAETGAVDTVVLGQARLYHDITSNADRSSERQAAHSQLLALRSTNETSTVSNVDPAQRWGNPTK